MFFRSIVNFLVLVDAVKESDRDMKKDRIPAMKYFPETFLVISETYKLI